MPLFDFDSGRLKAVKLSNFSLETDLQQLIESNLDSVFDCRLVASEFVTGEKHGGRIDTLALSEENNPVIIEYKKVESSELINQSLFYLSWIFDHRGDFQLAVNKAFGKDSEVDWSEVRVICLAPGYKKYDLHAVQMMGANIELWQYRRYENRALYLEQVFGKRESVTPGSRAGRENLSAGQKAAITRATGTYTFDEHFAKGSGETAELMRQIRDHINDLGDDVEENPKKFYVAYKVAQNFVCMEVRKSKILLYLKLDPTAVGTMPPNGRNVSEIGHYGTGDFELVIDSKEQLETAYGFIKIAYENVGG